VLRDDDRSIQSIFDDEIVVDVERYGEDEATASKDDVTRVRKRNVVLPE
jgi:hypothetical protein